MNNAFNINYKINIYCRVWIILLLFAPLPSMAQNPTLIRSVKAYCQLVQKDSFQRMVSLKQMIPTIRYDLKYATADNFTGKKLYPSGRYSFLRYAPAWALKKIQDSLFRLGLGIKLFDAYRPHRATRRMWELVKDENYVAHPSKGSGHNRGLAIDLTLIELGSGKELEMGTGFDHFSDTAHHAFTALPEPILKNRKLLKGIMEANGFRALPTEWWHYSWPNDREYGLLDIEAKKLAKACNITD